MQYSQSGASEERKEGLLQRRRHKSLSMPANDRTAHRSTTRRTPPPSLAAHRGPNHVLVTRRSSRAALRARTRKLIYSGQWPTVFLHGLGAALAPAVQLAAELVQEGAGRLVASTSTSSAVLVDHSDLQGDLLESEGCELRHNSAIHIGLTLVPLHERKVAQVGGSSADGASQQQRRIQPSEQRRGEGAHADPTGPSTGQGRARAKTQRSPSVPAAARPGKQAKR